jgi:para-aminobenzoate synthetase component 1
VKKATTFAIDDFTSFRKKMLNWSKQFNIFCLLDNSGYSAEVPAFECLLATGCKARLQTHAGSAFEALHKFSSDHTDWLFGHLAYDLKNEIAHLQSANFDGVGFGDMHFFVPQTVLKLETQTVTIYSEENAEAIYATIASFEQLEEATLGEVTIDSRFSKAEYVTTVQKLQQHILRGDCYEINFCQEFFSRHANINPWLVYNKLMQLSPSPFAALYRIDDNFCVCASPERYLKKSGSKIISQPIKGTSRRCLSDAILDEKNRQQLLNSEKEKSENVMVVDLVRNDLSKVCKKGTVKVDKLFEIYSFPQVHQMISTVSGELKEEMHWTDAVQATFPMGSMTGAPKLRVMQLAEQYERTRRGLFSGAIGYVDPLGNCDFNVVIRSILYNAFTKYASFQTGSAITFYSNPELEYEECLLKAAALKKVLE